MSDHESTFLASITGDELGWLTAYNTILQEPSPSAPIPIPTKSSPTTSDMPNDSLHLLRAKGLGSRRRYQTSTKSSCAKSVHSSDRSPTRIPSPLSPRRVRTTSIRGGNRQSSKSSPVKLSRSPQQEWIYRQPKSPPRSTPSTASSIPSPTRPVRRPVTGYATPETSTTTESSESSPFWTGVLRSRSSKRPILPKLEATASEGSSTIPSPMSDCSSATASSSSSTISSHPPTSPYPSLKYDGQKYQRRYRDVSFDSTSSIGTLIGPPCAPVPARIKGSSAQRKNSVGTTGSGSSKSVKFVDLPTVHYASVGYWDLDQSKEDESTMGIDVEGMDIGQDGNSKHENIDVFAVNGPPYMDSGGITREGTPTPTPEKSNPPKRFPSFKRVSSSRTMRSSIPVPTSSRPQISGPFRLAASPPAASPPPRPTRSAVSIRNAPSVESFRSGGAKSIRSLSSLKSLPSSLKSTVTLNARGLREWFKERVVGLDIGVVG